MKKFLAMLMAVMMVLSLVTVPVMAETPAANDPRLSTAPKTGTAAAPAALRTSMRLSTLQAEPSPSLLKATILGS